MNHYPSRDSQQSTLSAPRRRGLALLTPKRATETIAVLTLAVFLSVYAFTQESFFLLYLVIPVLLLLVAVVMGAHERETDALRTSEQRFRDFAKAGGDWFWETDAELRYTWVSENVETLTGVSQEWHYGKTHFDISDTDINPAAWQQHELQLAARQPFKDFELCRRGLDGLRWVRSSGVPVFDEQGRFQGYRGSSTDISTLKRAQQQAQEIQTRFLDAIDAVQEAYALYDADDRLLVYNAYYKALNEPLQDMIEPGMVFEDFLRALLARGLMADSQGREEAWLEERLAKFHAPEEPLEVRRADGRCLLIQEKRLADGSVLVTGRDVTELRAVEHSLREAKETAEASDRAKSEFLANMSHEIRTPLNAITGFAELLKTQSLDAKQRGYLDGILIGAQNLLRLINDILDLSKIEAGKMRLNEEPTDLRAIGHEIQQIFGPTVEKKGLSFVLDIDPELPARLVLDETRIRQVLLNLVGNATKFTEEGSIYLSVSCQTFAGGNVTNIILEVADTGIGIAEAQQTKIFEAFHQPLQQDNRQYGGTGLGLTITQRLIDLMRGKLFLSSAPGQGSVFRVNLPAVMIADEQETPATESEINLRDIAFKPAKLLLVDDVEHNREVVKGLLEGYRLQIVEAENGEQALMICSEFRPDVILMDMRMPVMDGYTATQRLKADPRLGQIPVLALTASVLEEEKREILKLCDDYLRKPMTGAQLVAMLMRHLPYELKATTSSASPDKQSPERIASLDAPLPAALVQTFREEIIPQFKTLQRAKSMSQIGEFANQIQQLGEHYEVKTLCEYGDRLAAAASAYKITQINHLMDQFQRLSTLIQA